jgi:hypothetical protein
MNSNRKRIFAAPLRFLSALLMTVLALALSGCPGNELDLPVPDQAPVITQQPADQSVTAGSSATFNVAANGGTSYQWQTLVNGNWTDIAGATAASHGVTNATLGQSGSQYRVLISAGPATVVSSAATLTVTVVIIAPAITVQPADQTVTEPAVATFNITATGSAPLTYQWQRLSGGAFANIAGATSATFATAATVRANDNNAQFRVLVTNSAGTATSNGATLTVNPAPVSPAFTTQPADITVTAPATASFTVAATGTPAPTLQWQTSSDGGGTWSNVSAGTGATTTTYTTEATSTPISGRRYRAIATNSAGAATSNAAILTVNPAPSAPVITTSPADATVYEPSPATFTFAATGTPSPTLQWQRSGDLGITWNNIVGATGTSYVTPATSVAADHDARFRVVAQNVAGTATSSAAILTVLSTVAPAITTHPLDQEVTGGAQITYTAAASGTPAPALRWQRTDDGGVTWTDIPGATSASYAFNPVRMDDGAEFRMVATNTAGVANSNAARFNNLATMVVLTSINAAGGGASTPPFQRFNGSGLDNAGNFVFTYGNESNSNTDVIRTIVPATGAVSDRATISTGVAATGVSFDPAGNMYVANVDRVRVVSPLGVQTDFASGINRLFAGIVYLNGMLYFSNDALCTVESLTVPGAIRAITAGASGVCAQADSPAVAFRIPSGLTLDTASGNMFLCDAFGGRLVSVTPSGTATTLPASGVGASFTDPMRLLACDWLTSDDAGSVYYLVNANVYRRKPNGVTAIVGRLPSTTETRILQWSPSGYLAVGNGGNLVRLDLR